MTEQTTTAIGIGTVIIAQPLQGIEKKSLNEIVKDDWVVVRFHSSRRLGLRQVKSTTTTQFSLMDGTRYMRSSGEEVGGSKYFSDKVYAPAFRQYGSGVAIYEQIELDKIQRALDDRCATARSVIRDYVNSDRIRFASVELLESVAALIDAEVKRKEAESAALIAEWDAKQVSGQA